MSTKYVATINLTSLDDLKTFIGIMKDAGRSVSISAEKPDNSSMIDNPIILVNDQTVPAFCPEIKIYASSTIDLDKAKEIISCENDGKDKKTAACFLLESVTNFRGYATIPLK